MRTIVVDDEPWMLERFDVESREIEGIELVGTFNEPEDALSFAEKESKSIELAFLDIDMPKMNGIKLADELRECDPGIIIYFLSAYEEYMPEVFRERIADYYILKPYQKSDLQDALRRAELLVKRQRKHIYVETFGRFNIYIDGKFVVFRSRIAKEILAILVNKRGTAMDNKEAYYLIWEDKPYDHRCASSYRKGLKKLRETLEKNGIGDILISSKKEHKLDISKFDCDYYEFLNHDQNAISKYNGEYMADYSWGEETVAYLSEMKEEWAND